MLIEPNSDVPRGDFDQFCQRVLQPAGNTDRPSHRYIQAGKLVGRQLGSRVDRSSRLADHDIGSLEPLGYHLGDERFCLARGRTVPNRDHTDRKTLGHSS